MRQEAEAHQLPGCTHPQASTCSGPDVGNEHSFPSCLPTAQVCEEVNAISLATCDPATNMPSVRVVLLKGFDLDRGFVFYTNYNRWVNMVSRGVLALHGASCGGLEESVKGWCAA